MEPSNDNRPAAEASRPLHILGRVGPAGRVILLRAEPPMGEAGTDPRFPNDPREA